MRVLLILVLMVVPQLVRAGECGVDLAAVTARLTSLESKYPNVLSDISCDEPTNNAHILMCDASYEASADLWTMGRLDTVASIYAFEKRTKRKADLDNPPRDTAFTEKRDACTDVSCVCETLIKHTNANLGGLSPYVTPLK